MYYREVTQFSIAGASASTGVILTNPLEVIKTRMQLRQDTLRSSALIDTARTIWAQEGLLGFWKGVQPAVLRSCTYGSLRLGLYEPLKHRLAQTPVFKPSSPTADVSYAGKCMAALSSGAFAALLTNPLEMLKVRAQAEKHAAGSILKKVYSEEGIAAMFNGVGASMQRSALLTGIDILYDRCIVIFRLHDIVFFLPLSGSNCNLRSNKTVLH